MIDHKLYKPCQFTYSDFSSPWSKSVDSEIRDDALAYRHLRNHLALSCPCTSSMSTLLLAEHAAFCHIDYIASYTRMIGQ